MVVLFLAYRFGKRKWRTMLMGLLTGQFRTTEHRRQLWLDSRWKWWSIVWERYVNRTSGVCYLCCISCCCYYVILFTANGEVRSDLEDDVKRPRTTQYNDQYPSLSPNVSRHTQRLSGWLSTSYGNFFGYYRCVKKYKEIIVVRW